MLLGAVAPATVAAVRAQVGCCNFDRLAAEAVARSCALDLVAGTAEQSVLEKGAAERGGELAVERDLVPVATGSLCQHNNIDRPGSGKLFVREPENLPPVSSTAPPSKFVLYKENSDIWPWRRIFDGCSVLTICA